MSKAWLIIIVLLIAAIGSGTAFLYWQISSPADTSPDPSGSLNTAVSVSATPTPDMLAKTITYTDPSGFSLSHPANLQVETAPDFDEEVDYAKISIKNSSDQMQVWLTDTTYKKTVDWLAKDPKAPKQADLVGASTLGGVAAEQYSDSQNLYTLAIDQGVLYYLVSPKASEWESVHEMVVTSFKFASTPTPATSAGGGETIYEEEEVIE
jgi:hypothetical protein